MRTYKPIPMILAFGSGLILSACTAHVKNAYEPEGGLTVSQIYHASVDDNSEQSTPHYRIKTVSNTDYDGYTRTAANETKMLFKPLDNPIVPIFVYPHVALIGDEQILKPGYTTAFFLYKQNQFALASEQY